MAPGSFIKPPAANGKEYWLQTGKPCTATPSPFDASPEFDFKEAQYVGEEVIGGVSTSKWRIPGDKVEIEWSDAWVRADGGMVRIIDRWLPAGETKC